MATNEPAGTSHPVVFITDTAYPLPAQKFMIPTNWKRYQLSQLVNKALALSQPVPFDFIIRGEILHGTLAEWCSEKGVGEEETLEIEYIESVMPPQKMSNLPHEDWVSSVSCQPQGSFLTASYDGNLRAFDYSQKLTQNIEIHSAPITSFCIVPSDNLPSDRYLIVTASQDLTARITQLSLDSNQQEPASLASLHLHTGPVSSVATDLSGSHLLTSSWDGMIGLWDTTIPSQDEVPLDAGESGERTKRRKIANTPDRPKCKAPVNTLRSHTGRVSRVTFGRGRTGSKVAYSCGFDSTVRTWDVENGLCTNTITAVEKPMLDLVLSSGGNTALVASTDRTVTAYDLRASGAALNVTATSLLHPATPTSLAPAPSSAPQILSGAHDGNVRLWDLRSTKSAVVTFCVWDGTKKVLALDWADSLVVVGGEGGVDIWRVGEDISSFKR